MGYNVSPELVNEFKKKNAADNAWRRKKIIKWVILIAVIAVIAFFAFRIVNTSMLRKKIAGNWSFGSNEMEILDDGRFTIYDRSDEAYKGRYVLGSGFDKYSAEFAAQGMSLSDQLYYYGELDNNDVVIGFLDRKDNPQMIGIYDPDTDCIWLYQRGRSMKADR